MKKIDGFLRLSQIVGNPKAEPPIPAIIPVGKSTWLAGVHTGRFPQPIKLGPRITVWKSEDIYRWIEEAACDGYKEAAIAQFNRDKKKKRKLFKSFHPLTGEEYEE